jgi:hypothetical protein
MQGAKKGLFQNSTNILQGHPPRHRATTLLLDGQNGEAADSQPKLVAQCGGAKAKEKKPKSGERHH